MNFIYGLIIFCNEIPSGHKEGQKKIGLAPLYINHTQKV